MVGVDSEQNKLSHNCLSQDLYLCVCVLGCVSCLAAPSACMSGRKTRKCKETLLQVKQRLTREQRNRTDKRVRELLDLEELDSDSDSEGDLNNSIDERIDSLSLLRRDLYLGLLCLLLIIVLQPYWFRNTCLTK